MKNLFKNIFTLLLILIPMQIQGATDNTSSKKDTTKPKNHSRKRSNLGQKAIRGKNYEEINRGNAETHELIFNQIKENADTKIKSIKEKYKKKLNTLTEQKQDLAQKSKQDKEVLKSTIKNLEDQIVVYKLTLEEYLKVIPNLSTFASYDTPGGPSTSTNDQAPSSPPLLDNDPESIEESLKKQIKQLEGKLTEIEEEVKDWKEKYNTLTQKSQKEAQAAAQKTTNDLAEKGKKIDELQNKVDELEAQATSVPSAQIDPPIDWEKKYQDSQATHALLDNDYKKQANTIQEKQEEITKLESDLEKLNKDFDQWQIEKNSLEKTLKEQEVEINEHQSDIEKLEKDLDELKKEYNQAIQEKNSQQQTHDREMNALQNAHSTELEAKDQTIDKLMDEKTVSDQEKSYLNTENESLNRQIDRLKGEVTSLKDPSNTNKKEEYTNELNAQIKDLEQELQKVQGQNISKQGEVDQLTIQRDNLTSSKTKLTNELEKEKQTNQTKTDTIYQLNQEKKGLDQQIAALNRQVNGSKNQSTQITKLEKEKTELENLVKKLKAENPQALNTPDAQNIINLKDQLNLAKGQNQSLADELAKEKQKTEKLKNEAQTSSKSEGISLSSVLLGMGFGVAFTLAGKKLMAPQKSPAPTQRKKA